MKMKHNRSVVGNLEKTISEMNKMSNTILQLTQALRQATTILADHQLRIKVLESKLAELENNKSP